MFDKEARFGSFRRLEEAASSRNLLVERRALFERVRTAVVLQRTEEVTEEFCRPENHELLGTVALKFGENILKAIIETENIPEEEAADMEDEVMPEMISAVKRQFEDPNEIRKLALQSATNENRTPGEFHDLIKDSLENFRMENPAANEELCNDIMAAVKPLMPVLERRQQLLERMTNIAEIEGVEAAVSRNRRNELIRELLPTADDYRRDADMRIRLGNEMLGNMADAFTRFGGDAGAMNARLILEIKVMMEACAAIYERSLEREMADIYGEKASKQ